MVRQSFDVLAQPIRVEALDRVHDLAVEIAPPVLEETAVGHVVSQSMLEGVLEVRKDARLVQELTSLQARDRGVQVVVGMLGNRLKQRKRDVLTDHRRHL